MDAYYKVIEIWLKNKAVYYIKPYKRLNETNATKIYQSIQTFLNNYKTKEILPKIKKYYIDGKIYLEYASKQFKYLNELKFDDKSICDWNKRIKEYEEVSLLVNRKDERFFTLEKFCSKKFEMLDKFEKFM